jgi:hypothetical protein
MILTAHDAAELAAAAIADHLGVTGLSAKTYLMDYPAKIQGACSSVGPFPGISFLKQLNDARISFKHHGNLPDARTWFRVIENTWAWIDEWCSTYLGSALEEINLEALIEDPTVKACYLNAKAECEQGRYRRALEWLGQALYMTLDRFPGIRYPVFGTRSSEHALLLTAFGVRPSDFLNMEEFLPRISKDSKSGELCVEWNLRGTGHPGNWTEGNVRFRLTVCVDIILKIQHAPWSPSPIQFDWIFDDVIEPKGDSVDIWEYTYTAGFDTLNPFQKPSGRKTIRTLMRGESLRCRLSPSRAQDREEPLFQGSLFDPTMEDAEIFRITSKELPSRSAYVERKDVSVSYLPREDDFVRTYFPHLFRKDT